MEYESEIDLSASAPWSGQMLRRLGKAITGDSPILEEHPSYDDITDWYARLAAQIAAIAYTETSMLMRRHEFDVSTRAKTIDTLRQKLRRESSLRLHQVQDLAGVRLDVDCSLDEQTELAELLATRFRDVGTVVVKDIRDSPHSGYRAVHLWLRLPAGRVEIQIRTRGQSAWANAYEQLGDTVGRGIRYGESHADPVVQGVVEALHAQSAELAGLERTNQHLLDLGIAVESVLEDHDGQDTATAHRAAELTDRIAALRRHQESQLGAFVEAME